MGIIGIYTLGCRMHPRKRQAEDRARYTAPISRKAARICACAARLYHRGYRDSLGRGYTPYNSCQVPVRHRRKGYHRTSSERSAFILGDSRTRGKIGIGNDRRIRPQQMCGYGGTSAAYLLAR